MIDPNKAPKAHRKLGPKAKATLAAVAIGLGIAPAAQAESFQGANKPSPEATAKELNPKVRRMATRLSVKVIALKDISTANQTSSIHLEGKTQTYSTELYGRPGPIGDSHYHFETTVGVDHSGRADPRKVRQVRITESDNGQGNQAVLNFRKVNDGWRFKGSYRTSNKDPQTEQVTIYTHPGGPTLEESNQRIGTLDEFTAAFAQADRIVTEGRRGDASSVEHTPVAEIPG